MVKELMPKKLKKVSKSKKASRKVVSKPLVVKKVSFLKKYALPILVVTAVVLGALLYKNLLVSPEINMIVSEGGNSTAQDWTNTGSKKAFRCDEKVKFACEELGKMCVKDRSGGHCGAPGSFVKTNGGGGGGGGGGGNGEDPTFYNCALDFKLKQEDIRTSANPCDPKTEVERLEKDFTDCSGLKGEGFNASVRYGLCLATGREGVKVKRYCCQNQKQLRASIGSSDCTAITVASGGKNIPASNINDYIFICSDSCSNYSGMSLEFGTITIGKSKCRMPTVTGQLDVSTGASTVSYTDWGTCCMYKKQ